MSSDTNCVVSDHSKFWVLFLHCLLCFHRRKDVINFINQDDSTENQGNSMLSCQFYCLLHFMHTGNFNESELGLLLSVENYWFIIGEL